MKEYDGLAGPEVNGFAKEWSETSKHLSLHLTEAQRRAITFMCRQYAEEVRWLGNRYTDESPMPTGKAREDLVRGLETGARRMRELVVDSF